MLDTVVCKDMGAMQENRILKISVKKNQYILLTEYILYLESENHKVLIYTENECYTVYEKLSNLYKRLPSYFVQTHKSFVVNMHYIKTMERVALVLKSGGRIPISRTKREYVRSAYLQYLEEKFC